MTLVRSNTCLFVAFCCLCVVKHSRGSRDERKFEANADGSTVTALAWNGVVLVVGSARGVEGVWYALTFECLREECGW
jgi:hypothetical protein